MKKISVFLCLLGLTILAGCPGKSPVSPPPSPVPTATPTNSPTSTSTATPCGWPGITCTPTVTPTAVYPYLSKWGGVGAGSGQFQNPWAVTVDNSGNVYVSDTTHPIQKFDSNGNFTFEIPFSGIPGYDTEWNRGLATDSSGNLYAVFCNTNGYVGYIDTFTSGGASQLSRYAWYTSPTPAPNGELNFPTGVAVNQTSGTVYIADNNILRTDTSLNYQGEWVNTYSYALAVDSSGNIYSTNVVTYLNSCYTIQKYNSSGTLLTTWGTCGTGNGQFSNAIYGLAVDGSGNVFATDFAGNRVEKFDSNGNYLAQWGSYGTGDGQFNGPLGIAADSAGDIYVVDQGNSRVEKFAPH